VGENDLHVIAHDEDGLIEGYTRIVLETGADCAIVDTMCVRKDLHGRGIGSIVMRAANQAILREGRIGLLSCDVSITRIAGGAGSIAHC
jgi:hypothetical protein